MIEVNFIDGGSACFLILVGVCFIMLIAVFWISLGILRDYRIERYLKKCGYRRYIWHIPFLNNSCCAWEGWQKGNIHIHDSELDGLSLRKIKQKYR